MQARAAEGATGLGLLGRQDLAAAPPVSAVLEAPALFALMQALMQVIAHTFEAFSSPGSLLSSLHVPANRSAIWTTGPWTSLATAPNQCCHHEETTGMMGFVIN